MSKTDLINIFGTLHNVKADNTIAESSQVYDDVAGKSVFQLNFNTIRFKGTVTTLPTKPLPGDCYVHENSLKAYLPDADSQTRLNSNSIRYIGLFESLPVTADDKDCCRLGTESSYTWHIFINDTWTELVFAWTVVAAGSGSLAGYKPIQEAKEDPTSSGNATSFIDSISQDANGVITATKKKVNFTGYKTSQIEVSDPTASGDATAFIDSISQSANGEITVTKKNVNFPQTPIASDSTLGGVKIGENISVTADGTISTHAPYVHPTKAQTAADYYKTGCDDLGHVVLGDSFMPLQYKGAVATSTDLPTADATIAGHCYRVADSGDLVSCQITTEPSTYGWVSISNTTSETVLHGVSLNLVPTPDKGGGAPSLTTTGLDDVTTPGVYTFVGETLPFNYPGTLVVYHDLYYIYHGIGDANTTITKTDTNKYTINGVFTDIIRVDVPVSEVLEITYNENTYYAYVTDVQEINGETIVTVRETNDIAVGSYFDGASINLALEYVRQELRIMSTDMHGDFNFDSELIVFERSNLSGSLGEWSVYYSLYATINDSSVDTTSTWSSSKIDSTLGDISTALTTIIGAS